VLLYLHIPFCDSKCHYCAFNSYTHLHRYKKRYMEAINRQLDFELERFESEKEHIKTLFIGGGTPSTVEAECYGPFFEKLRPFLAPDAEITTEANPGSATSQWLCGMRDLGVNRVSFGVQSFDAKKLKFLGRNHDPHTAQEAPRLAREAGFSHISIDLVYATALDSRELLQKDLDIAFSLPIDHLSAYALTLEEKTLFFSTPEVLNDNAERARWLGEEIRKRGFGQYEISNFGRYRCRHNLGYWQLHDYIGIGSGAVGFLKDRRFYPPVDIRSYIENPLAQREERLTFEDLRTEKVLLGLRSIVGVEATLLKPSERQKANLLVEEGKLDETKGLYFNKDYYLSDAIALFLLE